MAIVVLALLALGQAAERVEPEMVTAQLNGKRIVVEGVFSSASRRVDGATIRIRNCQARFLVEGERFEKYEGNMDIEGEVFLKDGDVFVRVLRIRNLSSDAIRYEDRAALAKTFEDWYKLGDWARARHEKYGDEGMGTKAGQAYTRGVEIQRKSAQGDPAKLRDLERFLKSRDWVEQFDYQGLSHEILHADLAALKGPSPDALSTFVRAMKQTLGASQTSVPPLTAADRKAYETDPVGAFEKADPRGRLQQIRYWEVMLEEKTMALKVEQLGQSARELANSAQAKFPDYPDVAARWWKKWSDGKLAALDALSPREMEDLAQTLSGPIGDRRAATIAVSKWLQAREDAYIAKERTLAERDANARYELAMRYLEFKSWLSAANSPEEEQAAGQFAQQSAARLLLECLAIDATHLRAAHELKLLGYDKGAGGKWMKLEGTRTASSAGVTQGMSPEEVERILGGAPDVKSKLVSATGIAHQWVYRAGPVTTYVLFSEPRTGGSLAVLRVFAVQKEPGN